MEEGLRASTVLFTKSGHQIIVSFSPTAWTSESAARVGGLAQIEGTCSSCPQSEAHVVDVGRFTNVERNNSTASCCLVALT